MSERLVTPVSNNLEKYYTYREYISKYNRAMRGEFYFEALLIDYAMLEDRLRSMLYYMGALQTRDSIKINCKKTQGLLKKNKTFKLKTKTVKEAGKTIKIHRKIAYESTNTSIATVDKNGKIKALSKGSCYIYVYAQNGIFARIHVTVKS